MESEHEITNSLKQIMVKVRNEFNSEKQKRELFEENILRLLEETTLQIAKNK